MAHQQRRRANWNMLYESHQFFDQQRGDLACYLNGQRRDVDEGFKQTPVLKVLEARATATGMRGPGRPGCICSVGATNLRAWVHCPASGVGPSNYIWGASSTDNSATWTMDAAETLQRQTADEGVSLTRTAFLAIHSIPRWRHATNRTILYYDAQRKRLPESNGVCPSTEFIEAALLPYTLATVAAGTTSDGGNCPGCSDYAGQQRLLNHGTSCGQHAGALLTGAVTMHIFLLSELLGRQRANVLLTTVVDYLEFTYVADGTLEAT